MGSCAVGPNDTTFPGFHAQDMSNGETWHLKEHQLEWCLHELETDVNKMAAARNSIPSPVLLSMAALHCAYAAKLVSQL